ncbi:MAG: Mth938-like domain-containing protein [Sphingomonadales bacterium]|jgi:uncharacterized protein
MPSLKRMEAEGRQLINGYGPEGFRISGTTYSQAVLVFPRRAITLEVSTLEELTVEHLQPLVEGDEKTEILLLGCGTQMQFLPEELSKGLAMVGIAADPMDSGAAARTYNMLMMEDRRVAALLLPIT